ncbi:MAG: SpoIIE family protein phosphatase [Candidatus Marinimicrobia bacterium]|nr:SpoIIE family protein phosphatase [Candidatus Neomarinimicrobiota bacterium]
MQFKKESLEVRRLRESVQELSILNEIATAVSGLLELEQVVDLIVHKCVKHLNVEQGTITLLEDQSSEKPFQTMVRKIDDTESQIPYHFGVQLSGWMLQNKKPLVVNDFSTDNRFKILRESDFSIKSLLSVPLTVKGNMMGLLNLFNKKSPDGFSDNDKRILSIIAAQSAQVIESARLYKQEQALRIIEEDLRISREIQAQLLPKSTPVIEGFDIAGYSLSAREVGGDYYDYIQIDRENLALCLGDISGKGIPAALIMANLQATLRAQAHLTLSCSKCLERSNKMLFHSTAIDKFATLFYAVVNASDRTLTYTVAGHTPPVYMTASGNHRLLEVGGTVLGFLENSDYQEETLQLEPGDLLVAYSDGITEAVDFEDNFFEEWRLVEVVRKHREKSSREIIDEILQAVAGFSRGGDPNDDMTLLVIKRKT